MSAFDSFAAVKRLREGGADERLAEAVVGVVRHAVSTDRQTLATKADIADLRADFKIEIAGLEARMANRLVLAVVGIAAANAAFLGGGAALLRFV